jgi:hypothetical protein
MSYENEEDPESGIGVGGSNLATGPGTQIAVKMVWTNSDVFILDYHWMNCGKWDIHTSQYRGKYCMKPNMTRKETL